MVDNIKGSEYINQSYIQRNGLEQLINAAKSQQTNAYQQMFISDQSDISDEAKALLMKEEEVEYFKSFLTEGSKDIDNRVELLKAQIADGSYALPSDDDLAAALLGNEDFKTLMGL